MKEFLMDNIIIVYIFIALVVALLIFLAIKTIQYVGLEKVRKVVYKGFLIAEKEFLQGENQEKFDFVVNLAKSSIPMPFNLFITTSLLRKVIQIWFELCKDLLDDGKLNFSDNTKGETENE